MVLQLFFKPLQKHHAGIPPYCFWLIACNSDRERLCKGIKICSSIFFEPFRGKQVTEDFISISSAGIMPSTPVLLSMTIPLNSVSWDFHMLPASKTWGNQPDNIEVTICQTRLIYSFASLLGHIAFWQGVMAGPLAPFRKERKIVPMLLRQQAQTRSPVPPHPCPPSSWLYMTDLGSGLWAAWAWAWRGRCQVQKMKCGQLGQGVTYLCGGHEG